MKKRYFYDNHRDKYVDIFEFEDEEYVRIKSYSCKASEWFIDRKISLGYYLLEYGNVKELSEEEAFLELL